jgi:hypothetical protein
MAITYDDVNELRLVSERIRQYEKNAEEVLFGADWRATTLYHLEDAPFAREAREELGLLSFDDRQRLVDLLDRPLDGQEPETKYLELFRVFMMQRKDKCFHEGEDWDRTVVLEGAPKDARMTLSEIKELFALDDDLDDDLDEEIPF